MHLHGPLSLRGSHVCHQRRPAKLPSCAAAATPPDDDPSTAADRVAASAAPVLSRSRALRRPRRPGAALLPQHHRHRLLPNLQLLISRNDKDLRCVNKREEHAPHCTCPAQRSPPQQHQCTNTTQQRTLTRLPAACTSPARPLTARSLAAGSIAMPGGGRQAARAWVCAPGHPPPAALLSHTQRSHLPSLAQTAPAPESCCRSRRRLFINRREGGSWQAASASQAA